ncbi:hypothetical protein [Desulforhopalus sp. IMCC35007]|uniref:hypothetical protein n=1 Tax=Desulforhopalus sp. IMCC35007 TaxID=2569543 RepID=UPI0010AE207E|nr:hypothetical protein [Desulforhopalus sp. IMCC35007]TKB10013.1 hypothetical protein FCL48_08585 [Desulforhopalus sp. IMCC35007]
MQIYLSIDDTDNLESIGSGQLAENLTESLIVEGLALSCSNITRHQLFYHDDIPYTSHNSSMCFTAFINDSAYNNIIDFTSTYLKQHSAPGSDPGLCVARESEQLNREALIYFGEQAKTTILNKDKAYQLANKTNVHLSEHGGTGDGVVGALAGIGLRLQGSDGRFRGWFNMGEVGQITTPEKLCTHPCVTAVVDELFQPLDANSPIRITDDKIKTILHNHMQVVPVCRDLTANNGSPLWATLGRKQVKIF